MADSALEDQARRRRSVRSLIVILILGVVGVLILTVRSRLRGPDDPEDMLEHLVEVRNDMALVAYTVNAQGEPDASDPVVFHNADMKMPLSAVSRLPVLLAYAKAVSDGAVAADEPVLVEDWQRHYLSGTDGGAHAKALQALHIKTKPSGFVMVPKQKVTLDQVVQAMIAHNDYAAGDYLLQRLGEQQVNEAANEAGLHDHDPVLPMTGLFLLASTAKDEAGAKAILARGREQLAQSVREAAARFHKEVAGTPAQQAWMDAYPTPGAGMQALWSDQAMTQGTARQYAAVLARVATGQWRSAAESQIVRRHLGWPLALEGNANVFTELGGKGGTLVNIMTEASYMVPKQGDFEGKVRVVVLLQRRMPMLRWFALVRSFVHQQFMLKLGLDRTFAETTRAALNGTKR